MANERLFSEVLDLICWGGDAMATAPGGNNGINVDQSFVDNIESEVDGLEVAGEVSHSGRVVRATLATPDVLLMPRLLLGPTLETNREWQWFGKESGAATFSRATLVGPVPIGVTFSFGMGRHASATLNAICRGPLGTETFGSMLKTVGGESAMTTDQPPLPGMLWNPTGATYNEIAAKHVREVRVAATAVVIMDYSDNDAVVTAVDVVRWKLTVDVTLRASKEYVSTAADYATSMLENPGKSLAVTLAGVGSQAGKVLTIRNCKWNKRGKATKGSNFTEQRLSAVCQAVDVDSTYTQRKLIDVSAPAAGLINFA